jgi:hypothetical protein
MGMDRKKPKMPKGVRPELTPALLEALKLIKRIGPSNIYTPPSPDKGSS